MFLYGRQLRTTTEAMVTARSGGRHFVFVVVVFAFVRIGRLWLDAGLTQFIGATRRPGS